MGEWSKGVQRRERENRKVISTTGLNRLNLQRNMLHQCNVCIVVFFFKFNYSRCVHNQQMFVQWG